MSPDVVMGVSAAAAFALILYLGRNLTTFFYDEWSIFVDRQRWDVDTFLVPYNEHFSAVPIAIFKALYETVGAAPYWPYRLVLALSVIGCAVLVYRFAIPRVGKTAALVPGLLTLIIGSDDLTWPWQLGFTLPVLAGVALLLCFDRGTARAEWAGGALVLLALASSGVGLAVLATAAVSVLAQPDRLRRGLRLLAVPVVLYGAWDLGYQTAEFQRENLLAAPQYAADAAGAAVGALVGLSAPYWPALALGLAALVAWGWLRSERRGQYLTIVSLPCALWLVLALGRAHDHMPAQARYLLPGAVFVAVVACEALRDIPFSRRAGDLVAAVVVFAGWNHVTALRDVAHAQFGHTSVVRAQLAAMSLARQAGPIAPGFQPNAFSAPFVVAGPYFAVVDRVGDPIADPVATIADSFHLPRDAADVAYFSSLAAGVRPVAARPPSGSVPPRAMGGSSRLASPACLIVAAGRTAVVRLAAGGLALRASRSGVTRIGVRRWGSPFVPVSGTRADGWGVLAVRRDRDPTPVAVSIGGDGDVRACTIRSAAR